MPTYYALTSYRCKQRNEIVSLVTLENQDRSSGIRPFNDGNYTVFIFLVRCETRGKKNLHIVL